MLSKLFVDNPSRHRSSSSCLSPPYYVACCRSSGSKTSTAGIYICTYNLFFVVMHFLWQNVIILSDGDSDVEDNSTHPPALQFVSCVCGCGMDASGSCHSCLLCKLVFLRAKLFSLYDCVCILTVIEFIVGV